MAKTVVALYRELDTAEKVVRELIDNGFRREDVSLVAQDRSHGRGGTGAEAEHREGESHAAAGAGTGAVVGGLAGLVIGLGALAIPGIGPIIAAGPLATTLAGAGIGAVAGGLIGALTGAGVPEEDAKAYAEGVRRGGTLVTVHSPDERADDAVAIMDRYQPIDINDRSQQWAAAGTSERTAPEMSTDYGTSESRMTDRGKMDRDFPQADVPNPDFGKRDLSSEGETHIPVVKEEMRVGKREVERGGVRVTKEVTEEPVEETHTVRDETVNVERRPADRLASEADLDAFQDQTFEVTETDEELITDKQAHVTEDVVISKQAEEHPETVRDTVRRTNITTEDLGQGRQRGRDFSAFDSDFRQHYDLAYANQGHDYRYYEPGYRFGYDLAGMDQFRGRRWTEIEPDARRQWERSHGNLPWDNFREAVRRGWERTAGSQETGTGQADFGAGSTGGEGYGTGMNEGRYTDPNNP